MGGRRVGLGAPLTFPSDSAAFKNRQFPPGFDLIVQAPYPMHLAALFTRDPAAITDVQILMARMALRGIFYGDDVTHIVTEEGIANLVLCRSAEERQAAIRGVAGYTPVGLRRNIKETQALRARGIIRLPEDLGVSPSDVSRSLLAAQDVKGLVRWSGGLYDPPSQFIDW